MSDSLYLATAKEVGGEARIGAALIAIAESVAELVKVIKAQQVPVELATIEPIEFELATVEQAEPVAYVVIDAQDDVREIEPNRRKAELQLAEHIEHPDDYSPYRLGVVYELVDPS